MMLNPLDFLAAQESLPRPVLMSTLPIVRRQLEKLYSITHNLQLIPNLLTMPFENIQISLNRIADSNEFCACATGLVRANILDDESIMIQPGVVVRRHEIGVFGYALAFIEGHWIVLTVLAALFTSVCGVCFYLPFSSYSRNRNQRQVRQRQVHFGGELAEIRAASSSSSDGVSAYSVQSNRSGRSLRSNRSQRSLRRNRSPSIRSLSPPAYLPRN